jgi:hypothetical protein
MMRRVYRVRCHLCMKDFGVPFRARDDGAWAVFDRILVAHHNVSPSCNGGRDELQIIKRPRAALCDQAEQKG